MVKRKNLDKNVSWTVRRYVEHIKAKGIPVQKVIVFGSWARGASTKDSDIDVCLVSEKFGHDEIAELQFLLRETRKVDDRIEPTPLSLDDFENNITPLVLEIKKHGQKINL